LALGPEDLRWLTALRLRARFAAAGGSGYLIEKLPINNFRIGYLARLHPRAKFVHLVRDGLEVARSIARRADSGRWYLGAKWQLLTQHASDRGLGDVVALCTDNRLRG